MGSGYCLRAPRIATFNNGGSEAWTSVGANSWAVSTQGIGFILDRVAGMCDMRSHSLHVCICHSPTQHRIPNAKPQMYNERHIYLCTIAVMNLIRLTPYHKDFDLSIHP